MLAPRVTIAGDADLALAERLHALAHARCFIANSCSAPVRLAPRVSVTGGPSSTAVPTLP